MSDDDDLECRAGRDVPAKKLFKADVGDPDRLAVNLNLQPPSKRQLRRERQVAAKKRQQQGQEETER